MNIYAGGILYVTCVIGYEKAQLQRTGIQTQKITYGTKLELVLKSIPHTNLFCVCKFFVVSSSDEHLNYLY